MNVASVRKYYLPRKPSKISKNARPHENPLSCDSGADFDIESVIPKSELLTNKMFTEMAGRSKIKYPHIGNNVTIPKDLPKSLTITPAPPVGYPSVSFTKKQLANNLPHVTLHPEPKKPKKTHKRSATVPDVDFTTAAAAAKQQPGLYGVVMANYQQIMMSMMSRNLVTNPMHNKPAPFQQSSNKQLKTQASNNRKDPKFSKTLPYPISGKRLSDVQLSTAPSNSSRNFQPTPSFRANQPSNKNQQAAHRIDSSPLKFSTTPMAAHSPNKMPLPIARQPSPAMHQSSSQKTLQQKLAEQRQKSLQQEAKKQE